MEEFLDTQEAADFIKHSVSTLESWRADGIGPKWYKPSVKVVYSKSDLIEWVKGDSNA